MKYKILILVIIQLKKYSKFTSKFVDDRNFYNFIRGLDKGFYGT